MRKLPIVNTLLFGCISLCATVTNAQVDQIPQGQVKERVVCAKSPTQSYAVYLPSAYEPARAWPILYVFDPGARGALAVNRFRDAAEQYGWIVVGSNNSRNGIMQNSLEAWLAEWDDTHERFTLDAKRIYLAGMSGGARTALYLAKACRDCAAGVIAFGAGFPEGMTPSADLKFAVFGMAGVDDFNYPELRSLDTTLSKAGVTHLIESFDGRHEWPPPAAAAIAVEWMEIQAIKAGRKPRDEKIIAGIWDLELARAKTLAAAKSALDAYRVYVGMAESFAGLKDARELNDLAEQIKVQSDNREVKAALRDERRQFEKQQELIQQLYSLLAERRTSPDPDIESRFRALVGELRSASKAAADNSERRVARRVLESMMIGLLERGTDQLQRQKRYADAALSFQTAVEIDPDRARAFYFLASAYALDGDKKKALQALQKAVDKGFSDREAVITNSAFDSLRNEPIYLQLLEKLIRK